MQRPQGRDALEVGIALDGLEGLHGVILVAALELRDAEQQMGFRLVLQPALGQALGERIAGLVVLLVSQVCKAHTHVLVAGRRAIRIGGDLRQLRQVLLGRLLRRGQQTLVLVLGARVREYIALEALLQDVLGLAGRALLDRKLRHLGEVLRLLQYIDFVGEPERVQQRLVVHRRRLEQRQHEIAPVLGLRVVRDHPLERLGRALRFLELHARAEHQVDRLLLGRLALLQRAVDPAVDKLDGALVVVLQVVRLPDDRLDLLVVEPALDGAGAEIDRLVVVLELVVHLGEQPHAPGNVGRIDEAIAQRGFVGLGGVRKIVRVRVGVAVHLVDQMLIPRRLAGDRLRFLQLGDRFRILLRGHRVLRRLQRLAERLADRVLGLLVLGFLGGVLLDPPGILSVLRIDAAVLLRLRRPLRRGRCDGREAPRCDQGGADRDRQHPIERALLAVHLVAHHSLNSALLTKPIFFIRLRCAEASTRAT